MPSISVSRDSGEKEQDNQFSLTKPKSKVAAPRTPGLHTSPRPGLVYRSSKQVIVLMRQSVSRDRLRQGKDSGIIYHKCYKRNFYTPNCLVSLRVQGRVVQYCELLTPAEKMFIATASSHRVHAITGTDYEEDNPYNLANTNPALYPRRSKYRYPSCAQSAELHLEGTN